VAAPSAAVFAARFWWLRRPCRSTRQAADAYRAAGAAMQQVSDIFPFSPDEQGSITDDAAIGRAADHLIQARDSESRAMQCLSAITKIEARRRPSEEP